MQIVVLASQKGGSGKTTLSGHLAVEAEKSGTGPVVLIDTDPQGSLSDWWNARASDTPVFARVAIEDLGDCLAQLREAGVALVVIDTPPAITQSIASVVSYADLVVIPARPSPHDLRAVGATIDIVEHFGKPLIFVINAATARAKITGESAVALSQHGTVAPVTLHHRVDFAASMIDGKTIGEIDAKSKSAREVTDLWAYVAGRLARLGSGTGVVPEAPRVATNLDALSSLPIQSKMEEPVEVHAHVAAVLVPEAEPAPQPAPPPVPEPEPEPEDLTSAILDGASVEFDFDPLFDLREVPVSLRLAPTPAPVWSPPPPPPLPRPPYPEVPVPQASIQHASGHSSAVFGRRRSERMSAQAGEKAR